MTATQTTEAVSADSAGTPRPRRRRWPYVLGLVLALTLLVAAGLVAYRTPLLRLHNVEVIARSGELSPAVRDAVDAAVNVPIGTPLVRINLGAVRRAALAVPQVAAAAVSRRWPNQLDIVVTQRTPAAVTSANGALWLLDTTGFPYLRVEQAAVPPGLLPVELATPGPADPATLAALAVIADLPPTIRSTVKSVSARSPYAVTLNLQDGRTVFWGSPDEGAQKVQILPAVLARPGRHYDVSDPQYVTVGN